MYNNNKSNNVSSNSNNQPAPPSMPKASGAPMQQQQLQQMSQNVADDVSSLLALCLRTRLTIFPRTPFRSASSVHRRLVIQMTMTVIQTRTAARAPPTISRHSTWWTARTVTLRWWLTTITTKKVSWWIELSFRLMMLPDGLPHYGRKPQLRNRTITLFYNSLFISSTAPSVPSIGGHMDNSAAILRKDLCLSDSASDSDY